MALSIENICPDFLKFCERAQGRDPAAQQQLWHTFYEAPHQEIFDLYYSRWGNPTQLADALDRFPAIAPRVRELSSLVEEIITQIEPQCARLFDAPEVVLRYVLLVGLFSTNGWATTFRTKPTSFLAMEAEENRRLRDIEILVAHEGAHTFHASCSTFRLNDTVVGEGLFIEGLAIVASILVFPGAPEVAYLCPGGERTLQGQDCHEWLAECDNRWPELRRFLLRDLERSDQGRFAAYFWGRRLQSDPTWQETLPSRSGYVAGYRVVSALNTTYTISDMARWSPQRAMLEMRQVLERMPALPS